MLHFILPSTDDVFCNLTLRWFIDPSGNKLNVVQLRMEAGMVQWRELSPVWSDFES